MRTHHPAASALTLLLCLLLCGCTSSAPSRKHALLLAAGDEGYYWENLIEGAQDAAADNGWELSVQILSPEEDVSQALADADGSADLIALAPSPQAVPEAAALETPLALLGNDAPALPAVYRVYDTILMGTTTGGSFFKYIGLQKDVLLVVDPSEYAHASTWRTRFLTQMGFQGSRILRTVDATSEIDGMAAEIASTLAVNPSIDGIVCTTQNGTCAALHAVRQSGRFVPILGADFNQEIAQGIYDGYIRASVVRNGYAYGYMGIENAILILSGQNISESRTLDALVIDKDNLFDDAYAPLLYGKTS